MPARTDRTFHAVPYKADVTSLVWYFPIAFEERGDAIPETRDELKALTERIAADGRTCWCIGLCAGAATGWPATDWVKDLMLRTQPPKVSDQLVTDESPFADTAVICAIEECGWFVRNDAFVAGGTSTATTINYRDSPAGLSSFPTECHLDHHASFVPTFFPRARKRAGTSTSSICSPMRTRIWAAPSRAPATSSPSRGTRRSRRASPISSRRRCPQDLDGPVELPDALHRRQRALQIAPELG